MPEAEVKIWIKVLKRCQLLKHPSRLYGSDRQMQYLILQAMSANPNRLPNRKRLELWFEWHVDNYTDTMGV